MPPAVRLSDKAAVPADKHGCPGCPHPGFGPAVGGSTNVFINKKAAIRLDDPGIHMACCGANQWNVAKGSGTVYVNGKPLARMGDKTKHCGGSGALIMGSPNVFIDDGASGSMLSKLLKALESAARDALIGKIGETKAGKAALWALKAAKAAADKSKKAKAGKGDDKKGKGGKGKADSKKDSKKAGKGAQRAPKKAASKKRPKDLSKDVHDSKGAGGITRVALLAKAARPKQHVPFEVTVDATCKGAVVVDVMAHADGGKPAKKSSTSVTAKGKAGVLKGSVTMPELATPGDKYQVVLHAHPKGKPQKPVASNECVVSKAGRLLVLWEPAEWTEHLPARRPGDVKRVTHAHLSARGVTGVVKARVKVGGKAHDVTFNEDGIAVLPPEHGEIKDRPVGEAFDAAEVTVEIVAPASLKGKYRIRAFSAGK